MPRVTVLMPCYNAGKYLPSALESVIKQTYADLEIIAIDDCSSDGTLETLSQYAQTDSRVKVVRNPVNLGLVRSLNKGIDLSKGIFIARMDQDDICLPDRIEKQVRTLENDRDLELVSSRWMYINENGKEIAKSLPRTFSSRSNLFESFFGPPFGHPTVMIRTSTLKKYHYRYSEKTEHIEDYDLWSRMLMDGAKTRVINEVLLKYRHFSGNTTHTRSKIQDENMLFCAAENLKMFLGICLRPSIHRIVLNRQDVGISSAELVEGIEEFNKIQNRFIAITSPDTDEMRDINCFASNHITDILIQYLTKNKKPSLRAASSIAIKHLNLLINPRNVIYVYQKFVRFFS